MSRVYFHSPSREAELRGSERAWLGHVADGPARAAWDLDGTFAFDRAVVIAGMIPEVPDGEYGHNFLHTSLRAAMDEDARNKGVYAEWKPGTPMAGYTSHDQQNRFLQSLKLKLGLQGVQLVVAGVEMRSNCVSLNTALAAGSDAVALAAKIHGWCESHLWVDGPDRAWLADVIDSGLDARIYRRGLWYVDRPSENPEAEPDRKWSSQGWEDVLTLLRERDDEPVVMSYSVCDSFPNRQSAGMKATWPEGVEESWDAYDKLSDDVKRGMEEQNEQLDEEWYALTAEEQWSRALAGLRENSPWLQLTPESLRGDTFSIDVNVYDLFATDRDKRVREAAGLPSETVAAS